MNNLFMQPHLELVCPACHAKRDRSENWKNEFSKHDHYKFDICDCGYKIFIKSKNNSTGIIEKNPHFSIKEVTSQKANMKDVSPIKAIEKPSK